MNKEAFSLGYFEHLLKNGAEVLGPQLPTHQALQLPHLPDAPSRSQVADKVNQGLGRVKTEVLKADPPLAQPFNFAQHLNQQAGNLTRQARLNYFNPALATATNMGNKYTNLGNFKIPGIDPSRFTRGLGEASGKELYDTAKTIKNYGNWWENLRSGVTKGIGEAIPALGEINKGKEDLNASINNWKKNWITQHDPQLKDVVGGVEKIEKFENVPPILRALGLTTERPIIPDSTQFKAFQEILSQPKINEAAIYGLTHDPSLVKEVAKGALNPVSVGSIARTAGNAAQASANAATKLIPTSAGRVLPTLTRALPAVAATGKTVANLGKGLSAFGLASNAALEVPRIAGAGGVRNYVKDILDRQRYSNAPLSYLFNVVSNINSPVGTLLGTGKMLTDPETYQGTFETLKDVAKKQNFDRVPITI